MPLDFVGNVSLVLQVVILFILVLGIPFVKGVGTKKNFIIHGYLTVVALVLHAALIFLVMVPSFSVGLADIGSLPLLYAANVWSHIILGTLAEVLGVAVVVLWLSKPLTSMGCMKLKKAMMPLFIIWAISVINGALIHILQMM